MVAVYILLVGLGAVLIVGDPIGRVDAVVVLSGDDGDRLVQAIEFHADGLAPNLVITDTSRTANARLRKEALAGGFKASQIYLTEQQVNSTVDEARAALEVARNQGWDSLMVVTDPYHSFRTRLIFRRVFRGSGIEIVVRPVAGHWFRSSTWFYRADGWRFAFSEVIRTISYLFTGK